MHRGHRSGFAALFALSLVAAGCGGGDGKEEPTTTTTAATTAPPAPPPAGPGDAAPLTGLSQPDAAVRSRVALVVKIDNAPKGRPQVGINQADIVYEQLVEGGVTRLAAVFHSTDSDVGPVRSARSTDISIVSSYNRPLFAYAGTNTVFQQQVNTAPLVNLSHSANGGAYRRDSSRPAPYNLFTSTAALYRLAPPGAGAPPPQFQYRPAGTPLTGGSPAAAKRLQVTYRDKVTTEVVYEWNGTGWARVQNGTPHVDAAGTQVAPANVVVQFVNYRDSGIVDRSNTRVPEGELVGQGEAWVLSDGKIVRGRWAKGAATDVTRFTDAAGAPIALTPGRTWVELAPPGTANAG